jgi:acetoin utilization deacetylase AcuC-like enzyme
MKQAAVVRLALDEGLVDLRSVAFDEAGTWADIASVHDPAYVEAVRTGEPRRPAESQGFTWSPEFADAVARIWSGHIAACRLARSEGLVFHPVSGAHHARYGSGSGFCTFNFLAGAAQALLSDGVGRVAIIDLDAHPGDGTLALLKNNPRVALFDIAGGTWGSVRNIPRIQYHEARNAEEYRAALAHLPEFLDSARPDVVQYQAGVDCFERDHVGGIRGVNAGFLNARDELVIQAVVSRGIPLVINLAGGYVGDGTSERLHVQTLRVAAAWAGRRG